MDRKRSTLAVAAVLLAGHLFAASAAQADSMDLPGGRAAYAHLLGGLDPEDPDFAGALNRRLLASYAADGKWKSSSARSDVLAFLDLFEDLSDRFGAESTFSPSDRKAIKRFGDLAQRLGYKVKGKRAKMTLIPIDSDSAGFSRRAAQALGINLHGLVGDIATGRPARVALPSEAIDAGDLGPLDDWASWTGEPVSAANALRVLATDQRLSLLLEGRRRLDRATRDEIPTDFWRRADDAIAAAFYRYSASLQPCDGGLCIPGGESAAASWSRLLGQPPGLNFDSLRTLFSARKSRFIHLWDALAFLPDDTAAVYTTSRTRHDSLLRRIAKRLDDATLVKLDATRGTATEFDTLVRATPVDTTAEALSLPGGPGLWFIAAKVDAIPTTRRDLQSEVDRALKNSTSDDEYVLKALTETTERQSYKAPVLERLIPALGFFSGQPRLATPEAVILVTRAADQFAPLIPALARCDLKDPQVVIEVILAAAHLDRETDLTGADDRMLAYQSGIDWMSGLAAAGAVSRDLVEEQLHRWARMHLSETPDEPTAVLDWIATTLEHSASELAPNASDPETALAASLVPPMPQSFEWQGLNYRADDATAGRARFQAAFSQLGVASPTLVAAIAQGRQAVEEGCTNGDTAIAHQESRTLRAHLAELPTWTPDPADVKRSLRRQLQVVAPERLDRALERIAKADKERKLERACGRLWDEFSELNPHLNNFLLAIVYAGLQTETSTEGGTMGGLVYRHQLQGATGADLSIGRRWQSATLEAGEVTGLGGRFVGSPLTLAEQGGKFADNASLVADLVRGGAWRSAVIRTPWHRLDSKLTERVAAVVDLGGHVAERAREEPHLAAFLRARIPAWRVEKWTSGEDAWLSPSDLWMLGLAAAFGDNYGPPPTGVALPEVLDGVAIDDVTLAGAASLWTNGRGRPWVGPLIPYEALDRQQLPKALAEREWLDLKLLVLSFLGRHRLPGALAPELLRPLIYDAHDLQRTHFADWEPFLRWFHAQDDDALSQLFTEWLKTGAYRLDL